MNEVKYLFWVVVSLIAASVAISLISARDPEIVKAFTYGITAGIGALAMAIRSRNG